MLKEEKFELCTKSQSLKADKILDLALELLPDRPTPFDSLDVLVAMKLAQYVWREMLAEQQIEAITLSGILGHKDVNTINKYLSINHYKSGAEGLKKIEDILDVEVL